MTRPMVRIHNTETDEIIDREMNDEEYFVHLDFVARIEKLETDKATKETAKTDLLAKLGITEDEAKLLLS